MPPRSSVKVWLTGISPMMWRRVLVPSSFTLRELHGVIQVAMGWEGIHLCDFQLRATHYGSSEVAATSPDVTLAALRFRKGARFTYEYDLSIPWRHEVRIEDRLPPEVRKTYPICTGGRAVLGVSLVEKPEFFLNGQPIDATAMFRGCPKARALPGSFENGFALRVVHSFPHEDGGDSGGGAFDRGHDIVCFKVFGVQALGSRVPTRAKADGGRRGGSAFSFPLRTLWKARLPAIQHRRCAVRVRVLLQITGDDGTAGAAEEVAAFEKVTQRLEDLGLSIAEGKALLAAVQHGTKSRLRRGRGDIALALSAAASAAAKVAIRWYFARCLATSKWIAHDYIAASASARGRTARLPCRR
jgi:Plasmid pRiA4b ORF-3-like protein